MKNWAPSQAQDRVYLCPTGASQNLSSYDDFLVEKSLAVFAIFRGQYQDAPNALQMLWNQVRLHLDLFAV